MRGVRCGVDVRHKRNYFKVINLLLIYIVFELKTLSFNETFLDYYPNQF
ncbi:MAG: hypothetical protein JWQ96_1561 [Segetibacter sp.]|nr:hypothetical protein [Segetibacter sp.]